MTANETKKVHTEVKHVKTLNKNYDRLIELAMQPNALCRLDMDYNTSHIVLPFRDNRIFNTIALHEHYDRVSELKSKFSSNVKSEPVPPPGNPTPPEPVKLLDAQSPLKFVLRDFNSDFSNGVEDEQPRLRTNAINAITRRCVCVLLAQLGLIETRESVISCLTDAVDHYLKTITRCLRAKLNSNEQGRVSEFPDILEHVFSEVGIGSISSVHSYYNKNVIIYEQELYQKCLENRWEYLDMINNRNKEKLLRATLREEAKQEIPELHVPEQPEDGGFGEENLPDLIPGLLILHTLEQEAAQINYSPDEDSINNSSASNISLPMSNLNSIDFNNSPATSSFLSPMPPQKRRKPSVDDKGKKFNI